MTHDPYDPKIAKGRSVSEGTLCVFLICVTAIIMTAIIVFGG